MNKRSKNMKKVNHLRSQKTVAIVDLLDELEEGTGGDFDGFGAWDIQGSKGLKGQLNSYRAQKIAQFLGSNISKQKLSKYSKSKDYTYSLTSKDIAEWLEDNKEGLLRYSDFNMQFMTSIEYVDNET